MAVCDKETITIVEAAQRLGISKNLTYAAAAAGQIPTIRIGYRILVPVKAFNSMLNVGGAGQSLAVGKGKSHAR